MEQVGWRVLARVFVPEREVELRERRQQQGGGIDLCTLCRMARSPRESGLLGQWGSRPLRSLKTGPLLLGGIEGVFCLSC